MTSLTKLDSLNAINTPSVWGRLLRFRLAATLTLFFFGASSPLLADKFFPQGVVGTDAGISAVTTIEITYQVSLGKALSNSEGVIRFFRSTNGTSLFLRVNGEGIQDQVFSEIPFVVGPGAGRLKLRYQLSSPSGNQIVFWTQIEETRGSVNGRMQFDLFEGAALSTSVPVDATDDGPIAAFSARRAGTLNTGAAVVNPTNDLAPYWALILDGDQNIVGMQRRVLMPMRQNAMFIDELVSGVPPDFDGFLVILSDRNLPVVALEQNGLELATTLSLDPTAIAMALPFAVGQAEDYLDANVNNNANCVIPNALFTLRQGSRRIDGAVSEDGNFLIGPLDDGQWQLSAEAEGFLALTQPMVFPRPPLTVEMTNLQWINPEWLEATLAPNTALAGLTVKPEEDFSFFFNVQGVGHQGDGPEDPSEDIQQAFQSFVEHQLPQLGIEVLNQQGETVILGGESSYVETTSPPPPGQDSTFLLRPNFSLSSPARTTVFLRTANTTASEGSVVAGASRAASRRVILTDDPTGEGTVFPLGSGLGPMAVSAAVLEFNPNLLAQQFPSRASMLSEVSRRFWFGVFARAPASQPLGSFALNGMPGESQRLSNLFTQLGSNSEAAYSTPLDQFYWEFLRTRPIGTRVQGNVEILP